MRRAIDADDYKQFISPLLFYRCLSKAEAAEEKAHPLQTLIQEETAIPAASRAAAGPP